MPHTKLLASGNPIDVDPVQSQLAQLDVSTYRTIRLSAGNGEGSPGPVVVAVSQIDQPGTPNANAIALVDSFTLAPGESASKVYEVLGDVVAFLAQPESPPLAGIGVFFTIYGRTDLGNGTLGDRTSVNACAAVFPGPRPPLLVRSGQAETERRPRAVR